MLQFFRWSLILNTSQAFSLYHSWVKFRAALLIKDIPTWGHSLICPASCWQLQPEAVSMRPERTGSTASYFPLSLQVIWNPDRQSGGLCSAGWKYNGTPRTHGADNFCYISLSSVHLWIRLWKQREKGRSDQLFHAVISELPLKTTRSHNVCKWSKFSLIILLDFSNSLSLIECKQIIQIDKKIYLAQTYKILRELEQRIKHPCGSGCPCFQ